MSDSVIGLAIPATLAAIGWWWQRRQDRRSVRVAIVAEVLALKDIAEEREYYSGLIQMAEHLESIPRERRENASLQVRVHEHYRRVYTANIDKVGYLTPRDAQLVVRFYQYVDSVVADVTEGGAIYEGTSDPLAYREAAAILHKAMAVADEIHRRYHGRWWNRC
ncbi:hypothetical protein IFT80_18965 [Pseudomonas sp. CFBP 8771]|uniref:hypothetical protein n=1 Tax=Pseudomonas sp. CFBP 8771 TaxID=2775285 RepID=UPI001783B8AC|nr:hypothetical protein [Pseudomonas sp. CFBP 8771]MBD8604723.1 hypothetical protein [Pseudomonas sp. CFBP 8771]